ncbi:hypothetical protein M758_6G064300 [Ceratodon purpureus]|nr:hypothetical protein M758_6G064300 [Ceratodon purpureus]
MRLGFCSLRITLSSLLGFVFRLELDFLLIPCAHHSIDRIIMNLGSPRML